MAENKNMELNDEMMAKATGGENDSEGMLFNIGDRVSWQRESGWSYGTIMDWDIEGFSYKVLVDSGFPSEGELIVKHARNLYPVDM